MAKVAWVIEKVLRGGGSGVEVDGPVEEGLGAADRENDEIGGVHGDGFDEHGFRAESSVSGDVGRGFGAGGTGVGERGVVGGDAEEGECGNVSVEISVLGITGGLTQ